MNYKYLLILFDTSHAYYTYLKCSVTISEKCDVVPVLSLYRRPHDRRGSDSSFKPFCIIPEAIGKYCLLLLDSQMSCPDSSKNKYAHYSMLQSNMNRPSINNMLYAALEWLCT